MKSFLGVKYWGYRMQSNAMTEIMASDLPHVEYNAKKKSISKADLEAWEKDMKSIEGAKPQKINLNDFIIENGTLGNP